MLENWFQLTKSDFFQTDFPPGREIPAYDIKATDDAALEFLLSEANETFVYDEANTSPWITVVYYSQHHAAKAAEALPKIGLRVYYPHCRDIANELTRDLRVWADDTKEKFVPAFGRYLFVQLPEDQKTFANIKIDLRVLEGAYNENCVANVICTDGLHSLTAHSVITRCQTYFERRNHDTDPKVCLRFRRGEFVRVASGNSTGIIVQIIEDVPMRFKLKSKIQVNVGTTSARLYVKVGSLEKC